MKQLDELADVVTDFIGSWKFIGIFFFSLFGWILLQQILTVDPYPYILLNLVLSTLAAVQGAVIMMSQKRQEQKDRARLTDIHDRVKKCEQFINTRIDKFEL